MDPQSLHDENERLRAVVRELRDRLEEPEDIVRAIRHGEVDALVIQDPGGERIYTVRRADVFYRAMVEDMQEGAAAVDTSGNVIYCNSYFAQLVNRDRTTIIGVPIRSFLLEPDSGFFDALTRQSNGVDRQEIMLRASDGAKVAVLATMNRLDIDDDEKIFCLMVTDLSQKKREEQLLAEGRRKDEFLAMLAHELRNPIAPIRTAAALLGRVEGAEPRVARAHQVIERQVAHMTRLIDDLLDVSRITRGTVRLDFEPVEVSVAVNRGLETARPLIDARQHQVTVSLPLAPLWVRGDVVRLSQSISNLLNNAAKFTPERGRISLTVQASEGWVSIIVRDDGIGIPGEMLPQIFDLFMQVDSTPNRAQGGLGIGLTLVRSLVEMHGGTVAARSAGPNAGSEFDLRLPLLPMAETRERGGSTGGKAPKVSHPRRRVMVVDDNRDAAEILTMFLLDSGHDVEMAFDGESALPMAIEFRPDLMLVDIGLPRMTGHELVRQLRAIHEFARTAFVAVTGYGQDHDRSASRMAGFDDHWTKPLDPESLLTYMDALPVRETPR